MHEHLNDDQRDGLRPPAARLEDEHRRHAGAAAAGGRADVLDAESVLGLQRAVGNAGVSSLMEEEERSPVHDVISSGGRPLEPTVRTDMESRLGHDFGDVRVHDDSAAAASAGAVNAHAYTVGSNIVFQRDRYDPGTPEGQTTLAHELTHVVQQRNGPVDGTSAPGGIKISDPGDRFEREAAANAERVMSDPAPTSVSAPVQRTGAEPDEVAGRFVQREPEEEEEIQMLRDPVQRDEVEEEDDVAG